jgi:hypothetical protein
MLSTDTESKDEDNKTPVRILGLERCLSSELLLFPESHAMHRSRCERSGVASRVPAMLYVGDPSTIVCGGIDLDSSSGGWDIPILSKRRRKRNSRRKASFMFAGSWNAALMTVRQALTLRRYDSSSIDSRACVVTSFPRA